LKNSKRILRTCIIYETLLIEVYGTTFMPGGVKAVKIDHAQNRGIMLMENGAAYTWGWNGWGQIGVGREPGTLTNISSNMESLAYSGGTSGLTFFSDPKVRKAFYDKYTNLYNLTAKDKLSENVTLVDVAAGYHHFVALDSLGQVWAWGKNTDYEIGKAGQSKYTFPQLVEFPSLDPGDRVISVSAHRGSLDRGQSFAITEKCVLWSWGRNVEGKLGIGTSTATGASTAGPKKVIFPNGTVITAVQGGDYHNVALDKNGNVYTWGLKTYCGRGSTNTSYLPEKLTGETQALWTRDNSKIVPQTKISTSMRLMA
jgi:alpha-tubulin suppressor-like RCC1 family protein